MGNFYNNVLLGQAEGLPPCLARFAHDMRFREGYAGVLEAITRVEIACLFSPSRRRHLWLRLGGDKGFLYEDWVCVHQECADWAEHEADRLCPFEELPDAFYRYLADQSRAAAEMWARHEPLIPDVYPLYENAIRPPGEGTPLVPLERIMDVLQMLGEPVGQPG